MTKWTKNCYYKWIIGLLFERAALFVFKGHDVKKRWKDSFLLFLSYTGNESKSHGWAGCSRNQAYATRRSKAAFSESWDDALNAAYDRIKHAEWERAVEGEKIPYFYKGEVVGYIRRRSDRLILQLLKEFKTSKSDKPSDTSHRLQLIKELNEKLSPTIEGDE